MIGIALLVLAGTAAALLVSRGPDTGGREGLAARAEREMSTPRFPEAPVQLTSDTEYVETKVLEGGDLLVTHWIRTRLPMERLSVTVPTRPGLTDQSLDVTGLVVAADGARVDSPDPVSEVEWVGGLSATQELFVRYQLSGVLQRSDSAAGRALATTTALALDVGRELVAKTQAFRGAEVLSLACLAPGAQAVPRPCGTVREDTWTVESEADAVADIVIAQFDLVAD